jgi:hypothetical protein
MEQRDDPSNPSGAYSRMAADWTLVEDIIAGPAQVRAKGELYLPKNPAETLGEYQRRLKAAPWLSEFEDILASLAAKPFGEEVTFPATAAVSDRIKTLAEDIDGRGNNLTGFARPVFRRGIAKGCHAILVDNTGRGEARTVAEERAAGVRPYWVSLRADDILDLKTAFIGGRELAYHARIKERAVVRDGYAETIVERVRELNRAPVVGALGKIESLGPPTWTLHEKQKVAGSTEAVWVVVGEGVFAPLSEIPLALFWTGEREGPQFVRSPIAALADKQMELYRALSRKEEAFTMTASPMLSANGLAAPEAGGMVEIGPNRVLYAPSPSASYTYLAPPADSLKVILEDIEQTRDDIRRLGMQPLTQKSGGVTATASSIEGAKAHSAVQAWALGLKDVLEQAFVYTSQWLGEDQTVEVRVDTEFAIEPFARAPLDALLKARVVRDLSQRTFWEGLQRFGVLSSEFNADVEEEALAKEAPPAPSAQDMLDALGGAGGGSGGGSGGDGLGAGA